MKKWMLILIILGLCSITIANDCITLEPINVVNRFILVVDRSGSMSGEAMSQAKRALKQFVDDMRPDDKAAIIAFDDRIEVRTRGTSDKYLLKSYINEITARGGTRLYDALGKASVLAHNSDEQNIIIFFTDGRDGGSHLRISDLNGINLSQGIYVYGIGLGDVNQQALKDIADKTNGQFSYTAANSELTQLYQTVQANYYQNFGDRKRETSRLIVRSIPSGKPVFLNGEKVPGVTPLVADNLQPGDYEIKVGFERGEWKCAGVLPASHKGIVNAREDDLGRDVVIVSDVKMALVFMDNDFVGYTSARPLVEKTEKKGFFRKDTYTDYSQQLVVRNIPKGSHTVRVVAMPDMDSFFAPLETTFTITQKNVAVHTSCFNNFIDTKEIDRALEDTKTDDPFSEMEDMFDELGE